MDNPAKNNLPTSPQHIGPDNRRRWGDDGRSNAEKPFLSPLKSPWQQNLLAALQPPFDNDLIIGEVNRRYRCQITQHPLFDIAGDMIPHARRIDKILQL